MLATPEDLRILLEAEDIDNARASFLLDAVSDQVIKFSDQTFGMHLEEEIILDGSGTPILLLPGLPVLDVLSVFEGLVELLPSEYEWNARGILRRVGQNWAQRFRNVTVTYSHGVSEVPPAIKNLVCRIAARGYVNPTAVVSESTGGYSAAYGYDAARFPQLSDIDKDLLREYMGRT